MVKLEVSSEASPEVLLQEKNAAIIAQRSGKRC